MFSFLLGLGAGALCVLNPAGTRRLLATMVVTGQDAIAATSKEATRWGSRVSEDMQDILAEARAQREKSK